MSTPPITDQDSSALAVGEVALPTDEQVIAYIVSKAESLQSKVPGYCSVSVEVDCFNSGVKHQFIAYSAYSGHGTGATMDEAIARVTRPIKGKSESELKREKAARLLAEADALEAKGGES